jgi:hypothetical protein
MMHRQTGCTNVRHSGYLGPKQFGKDFPKLSQEQKQSRNAKNQLAPDGKEFVATFSQL